jgi:hypothetical protein
MESLQILFCGGCVGGIHNHYVSGTSENGRNCYIYMIPVEDVVLVNIIILFDVMVVF